MILYISYYEKGEQTKVGAILYTNYKYILQNLSIPDGITEIIEPFAGNGDLLQFIDKTKYTV